MQRILSETEPFLDQLLCSVQTGVWFIQVKLTKISYIATKFKVRFIQDIGLSRVQIRQVFFKVRFIQDVGLSWVQIRQVLLKVRFIQGSVQSALIKVRLIQNVCLSWVQFRQYPCLSRVQLRQVPTVLIAIITFRHFIYLYRVYQTFLLLFCLGGGLDQAGVQKT